MQVVGTRAPVSTAITSLGMVSCIGHDVVTAAAARRAGIARRAPLEGLSVVGEEDLEELVSGAPITGLTDGYLQAGAWLRMAVEALDDLVAFGRLPGPGVVNRKLLAVAAYNFSYQQSTQEVVNSSQLIVIIYS